MQHTLQGAKGAWARADTVVHRIRTRLPLELELLLPASGELGLFLYVIGQHWSYWMKPNGGLWAELMTFIKSELVKFWDRHLVTIPKLGTWGNWVYLPLGRFSWEYTHGAIVILELVLLATFCEKPLRRILNDIYASDSENVDDLRHVAWSGPWLWLHFSEEAGKSLSEIE